MNELLTSLGLSGDSASALLGAVTLESILGAALTLLICLIAIKVILDIFRKLLGITPEYSRGDKFIAWAFFTYSFVYQFAIVFLLVLVWNTFSRWPITWWSNYYLIVQIVIPGVLAFISTFWFGYGGIRDLLALFRDLKKRVVNHLDNGTVDGNMSLADKAQLEALDKEEKLTE